MRYTVTHYQGSGIREQQEFIDADQAFDYAGQTPEVCVTVLDNDGWVIKDWHFSAKHPLPASRPF